MGLEVLIIGLAIILVIVAIFVPSLIDGFFELIDKANGFFTATELVPRPNQDEIICDLRVKTKAQLTQDFGIGSPEITIDPNSPRTYNYFECFKESEITGFQLADFDERDTQGLDFISFGGETIDAEIVIRDVSDATQKVDAFTQPQLQRVIKLDAGVIKTPLDISVEYVIKNIPQRDYILEIYYDRPINNMVAGEPFLSKICNLTIPATQCK